MVLNSGITMAISQKDDSNEIIIGTFANVYRLM